MRSTNSADAAWPDAVSDEVPDRIASESAQRHPNRARLSLEIVQALSQWVRSIHVRVAIGADDQHRLGTVAAQQMADDRQRSGVRPVQVVEHDEHRLASRHRCEKRVDRIEEVHPCDRRVTCDRQISRTQLRDQTMDFRRQCWCDRVGEHVGVGAAKDRTTLDHGKYAAAVSWSHQPYAIVESSAVEANSATSRVLPIPGSPDTSAKRRRPAVTLAHASGSSEFALTTDARRPRGVAQTPREPHRGDLPGAHEHRTGFGIDGRRSTGR